MSSKDETMAALAGTGNSEAGDYLAGSGYEVGKTPKDESTLDEKVLPGGEKVIFPGGCAPPVGID